MVKNKKTKTKKEGQRGDSGKEDILMFVAKYRLNRKQKISERPQTFPSWEYLGGDGEGRGGGDLGRGKGQGGKSGKMKV